MKSKNLIRILSVSTLTITLFRKKMLKNKWLGLLSIIILCFVQFSCKAQKCNTLLINNVETSKIKFLKIDCKPNKSKNNINSIKHIDENIDSMRISIIRRNGMVAESFLCNAVGVNIPVIDRNYNTYVNNLEVLLMIAIDGDLLRIIIFKDEEQSYIYIPLIINDNCH